ncbi:MAG: hypothetical protein EOM40_09475 [Clostridia bacterium]|nr:hypothetical protein [Clostridia bacterium]
MKKRILCLAMTVAMVLGSTMTVFAQDFQGSDNWQVDFDGDKMNSNFTSEDMTDQTSNIQPGDSIELKVHIRNSGDTDTDWYMTNEVIQTLEEATSAASGGAYEYRLSYVDSANEESVLYDSTSVGGDASNAGGEGLKQATASLDDYFYLDRLSNGEAGTVHLWVKVEGETQGNGYQQTLARLRMNFAVEEVAQDVIRNVVNRVPGQTVNITQVAQTASTAPVRTGDNNKTILFSAVALASGVILLFAGFYTLKKRKSSTEKGE